MMVKPEEDRPYEAKDDSAAKFEYNPNCEKDGIASRETNASVNQTQLGNSGDAEVIAGKLTTVKGETPMRSQCDGKGVRLSRDVNTGASDLNSSPTVASGANDVSSIKTGSLMVKEVVPSNSEDEGEERMHSVDEVNGKVPTEYRVEPFVNTGQESNNETRTTSGGSKAVHSHQRIGARENDVNAAVADSHNKLEKGFRSTTPRSHSGSVRVGDAQEHSRTVEPSAAANKHKSLSSLNATKAAKSPGESDASERAGLPETRIVQGREGVVPGRAQRSVVPSLVRVPSETPLIHEALDQYRATLPINQRGGFRQSSESSQRSLPLSRRKRPIKFSPTVQELMTDNPVRIRARHRALIRSMESGEKFEMNESQTQSSDHDLLFISSLPGTLLQYANEDPEGRTATTIRDFIEGIVPKRVNFACDDISKVEHETRAWHHANNHSSISIKEIHSFSLRFNECSVNAVAKWAAYPALGHITHSSLPYLSTADIKFRMCGICETWGHYEIECPGLVRNNVEKVQEGIIDAVKGDIVEELETNTVVAEECDGYLIEQRKAPRKKVDETTLSRQLREDKSDSVTNVVDIDGFKITAGETLSAVEVIGKQSVPLFSGDVVCWFVENEEDSGREKVLLQTGLVLETKRKNLSKKVPESVALVKPFRAIRGSTDTEPKWLPFHKLHLTTQSHLPEGTRLNPHKRKRPANESSYFNRVNRINKDGTFAPKCVPEKLDDGTYKAPRGRKPIGRCWDPERGIWAPLGAAKRRRTSESPETSVFRSNGDRHDTDEEIVGSISDSSESDDSSGKSVGHGSRKALYR